MVMVLGELLDQLVVREVAAGDDPVHDVGLLEHDEVPVHAAHREVGADRGDLGDRERAGPAAGEHLEQCFAVGRQALVRLPQPGAHRLAQAVGQRLRSCGSWARATLPARSRPERRSRTILDRRQGRKLEPRSQAEPLHLAQPSEAAQRQARGCRGPGPSPAACASGSRSRAARPAGRPGTTARPGSRGGRCSRRRRRSPPSRRRSRRAGAAAGPGSGRSARPRWRSSGPTSTPDEQRAVAEPLVDDHPAPRAIDRVRAGTC